MNWLYYLLEANLYLLTFYILYKLVFQRESFYSLNRFYLIASSILSFIVPLFRLGVLRPPVTIYDTDASINYYSISAPAITTTANTVRLTEWFIVTYTIIAALFLTRFGIRLYKIIVLARSHQITKNGGIKIVSLPHTNESFSFLNYLFIDPELPGINIIICHEKVHIRHQHTIDIVLFELLHVLNWFNPAIGLLKKEIKALHEFIADAETLNTSIDTERYAMLLISHSRKPAYPLLSSQMHSASLLQKRIIRLYQKPSRSVFKWKYMITLPITAVLITISSLIYTKTYGIDLIPQQTKHIFVHVQIPRFPASQPSIASTAKAKSQSNSKRTITIIKTKSGSAIIVPPTQSNAPIADDSHIYIDARSDTVKISRRHDHKPGTKYKGIYVIGNKIYSTDELYTALGADDKMDVVLPSRPTVGFYTENDSHAVKRWGKRALHGVMFVIPHDTAYLASQ